MTVCIGYRGNNLSGNAVEIVSIMGCLLHCFVVVLSASGILGHSLLLPPPLCHPLTEPVCVCGSTFDHKCVLATFMYFLFVKIDRQLFFYVFSLFL